MNTNRLDEAELVATLRAVHEAGSFTQAGKALFLTCPAVLYRIRQLEKLVGKRLYVRGERRRATLTKQGEALLRSED